MKISNIQTFIVDTDLRPWVFVKIEADEGRIGYGESYDRASPHGLTSAIDDLKPLVIGKDPRAYEMRFWEMTQATR